MGHFLLFFFHDIFLSENGPLNTHQKTYNQLNIINLLLSVSGSKIVKRIKPNQNNIMILK